MLLLTSVARFWLNGWVDDFFVTPDHFFHFWGMDAIVVPSRPALLAMMGTMALLSVLITLGLFYRVATFGFFALFTYVELVDVTNYLNHYYLVSLLTLVMAFLPANAAWSLDVRRRPALRRNSVPAWIYGLLRLQVGVVYVFAAMAKFNTDWLLGAQPLNIWLAARTDLPLVGELLGHFEVALAMSWLGFLFDLLIVPALLWDRTRRFAWPVALCFHAMTSILFNIGMFPIIMSVATTIFFAPSWPRRFIRGAKPATAAGPSFPRWAFGIAAVWCAVQLLVPLRFLAYEGPVAWHEQGMRFAWKVMIREKNGTVDYRVETADGRTTRVSPRRYLTDYQEREMGGQPDLILQLAHHIAADYAAKGEGPVKVYADSFASLNGRPPARLIDPTVDLAMVSDGLMPKSWILPAPDGPPIRLRSSGPLQLTERSR
ncbi:MAG: vitamin K-dependent gamma-carboxylase [Myxococcota bacterium]|jgi:vitamin K-dependent gamma-carboxylase